MDMYMAQTSGSIQWLETQWGGQNLDLYSILPKDAKFVDTWQDEEKEL